MVNASPDAVAALDTTSATKRRKLSHQRQRQAEFQLHPHHQPLIPGLPDHVAQLCLSHLPPSLLFAVCRSWRALIYSPSFPPFLSLYALCSSSQSPTNSDPNLNSAQFFTFDPVASRWHKLPPPAPDPPIHVLLRHPSFLSRNLPVQSIAINGSLILLAATTHNFFPALPHPFIFHPISRSWNVGPRLAIPRRWCAAGSLRGAVYVASGIGSHFSTDVARSVEKWDLTKTEARSRGGAIDDRLGWEKVSALSDVRFSRDAIDAVGWRGKLCMVNVKGDARKDGLVYDVEKDVWEKMPHGMVAGWRGPVAAMDEEEMYVVDEATGALGKYDAETDSWVAIMKSDSLKEAVQIAAGGRRVCVVCRGGVAVVDVTASPPRLWTVPPPVGFEVIAVHVLPRMSRPDIGFPVRPCPSMD